MGCWNATCQISGLPILAGEPVVGYLTAINDVRYMGGGMIYIEDGAYPLGLPFFGVYNDYGGIEDVKWDFMTELTARVAGIEPNQQAFEDFINDELQPGGKHINMHDDEVAEYTQKVEEAKQRAANPTAEDLEKASQYSQSPEAYLQESVKHWEGMLEYYQKINRCGLGYVLVHERVWKRLARGPVAVAFDYPRDKDIRAQMFVDAQEFITTAIEQKEFYAKIAETVDEENKHLFTGRIRLEWLGVGHKNYFQWCVKASGSRSLPKKAVETINDKFLELVDAGQSIKNKKTELYKLAERMIDAYVFSTSMHRLRRTWTPPVNSGQNTSYNLHLDLIDLIRPMTNARAVKFKSID